MSKLVKKWESITPEEIFKRHQEMKKILLGGSFWSSYYFVNTESKFGDKNLISKYTRVRGNDKDYDVLHKVDQLTLF